MSADQDILVELTRDELLELKVKYCSFDDAYYVYTLIDSALRWWGNKELTITSPGDSWRRDGSVVVFFERDFPAVFAYSLDKSCEKICEALSKTSRIDPAIPWKFHNIAEEHMNAFLTLFESLGREVTSNDENNFYKMSIEKAKTLNIELPEEVYIRKLDREYAQQMNKVWPHSFENSEKKVGNWIENNVGYGVFLKDGDVLVSWVLQGTLGHINMLQTEVEYKGRGYGKLILRVIAKYIAESGHVPVATVLTNNVVSNCLFRSQGFEVAKNTYFFKTVPKP
ncbi:uncharacterized protein LOC123681050 isoform X2 [Harmonia axyridis]|uniref:uncharacterized protein LOC123681050 isoform X2 n=1 Tax=Harmonia axyridis TaxID=115357 RepID=UPI001E277A63|nr:uncharacterized protein LOC123681050 isoform X2 [Harmonia axyridis]